MSLATDVEASLYNVQLMAFSGSKAANTNLKVLMWFCQRFNRHRRIAVIWE